MYFETENRGFFNITSKYMFILTDIQTHNPVYLNVYSLHVTISTWKIGCFGKYHRYWITVASQVLAFFVSMLYCSYKLGFFVLTCFKWTKDVKGLQKTSVYAISSTRDKPKPVTFTRYRPKIPDKIYSKPHELCFPGFKMCLHLSALI